MEAWQKTYLSSKQRQDDDERLNRLIGVPEALSSQVEDLRIWFPDIPTETALQALRATDNGKDVYRARDNLKAMTRTEGIDNNILNMPSIWLMKTEAKLLALKCESVDKTVKSEPADNDTIGRPLKRQLGPSGIKKETLTDKDKGEPSYCDL